MGVNVKNVHWTVVMLILWHLCVCDENNAFNSRINSMLTNLTRIKKNEQLDRPIEYENIFYHNFIDKEEINLDYKKRKRSVTSRSTLLNEFTASPNMRESANIFNISEEHFNSTRDTKLIVADKDEIVNNTLDNDFGKIKTVGEVDDSTTEFYDVNFTEPCVGDIEYCNMTREDYIEMLHEYIFPNAFEWVLICIHFVVFIIGLIGNALVCMAVYRNHSMRTVTNYFIVNLAVADFMVILICLPPTVLWDVTETWFFGTTMCRIVLYFQVRKLIMFR